MDLEKMKEFLSPIVAEQGCELVDLSWKKEFGRMALTLYIFKKGGVTLDDCEAVHNAVDAPLDELNPTGEDAYNLNVSSLGLDRPIVTDEDWVRSIDTEVEVFLVEPVEKPGGSDTAGKPKKASDKAKSVIVGFVRGFDGNEIEIETTKTNIKLNKENVAKARPFVRF